MKTNENTTATWIRAKLRANKPFLLDELTPSGLKLFVALGWKDNFNGYRDAKKKVAERVPARDWSLIDPDAQGFLQKSEETSLGSSNLFPDPEGLETYPEKSPGKWGGHLKQVVAISSNGMKHLLGQVAGWGGWLATAATFTNR
jgi:hypothetical protein